MEQRMSVRIPGNHSATIKPQLGFAISGELRGLSFDGAFFVTKDTRPASLLGKPIRLGLHELSIQGAAPVQILAHVVRTSPDGVALAFDWYDEAVNTYLERLYSERLKRNLATRPAASTSANAYNTTTTPSLTTHCAVDF